MDLGARVVWLFLFILIVAAAFASTGWALSSREALAWCIAAAVDLGALVTAAVVWAGVLEIFAEASRRRAKAEREWAEVERLLGVDLDRDGVIGRVSQPERIIWVNAPPEGGQAPDLRGQVFSLLRWCYQRQEAGLPFGQREGRATFGDFYDEGMTILGRAGLVDGRRQGVMGCLTHRTYDEAVADISARMYVE